MKLKACKISNLINKKNLKVYIAKIDIFVKIAKAAKTEKQTKDVGTLNLLMTNKGCLFLEILETGYFADLLFLHQRVLFLMVIGTKN